MLLIAPPPTRAPKKLKKALLKPGTSDKASTAQTVVQPDQGNFSRPPATSAARHSVDEKAGQGFSDSQKTAGAVSTKSAGTTLDRTTVSAEAAAKGAGAEKNNARNGESSESRPAQEGLPSGFFVLMNAEESSEKMPLAQAQSQIAGIFQQAGYPALSTGIRLQAVRTALDQGDTASIRKRGIGCVVQGTVIGALEGNPPMGDGIL